MPFADLPNARTHYALSGDSFRPALVLSNSLGTNFSLWDTQTPHFEKSFRLLRYDMRGHGQSSVRPAPYSVPELAAAGGDDDQLRNYAKAAIEQFGPHGIDADTFDRSEPGHPRRQAAMPISSCRERLHTQQSAIQINDRGDIRVAMRIDPTHDQTR